VDIVGAAAGRQCFKIGACDGPLDRPLQRARSDVIHLQCFQRLEGQSCQTGCSVDSGQ